MIAIAHKNPNESISGGRKIPDLAELGFVNYLGYLCSMIESVYPPGAKFTILTEGELYLNYGPLFDVTRSEVKHYESMIKDMAQQVAPNKIELDSLDNVARTAEDYGGMVDRIERSISESEYGAVINSMQKSLTTRQVDQGVRAEDIAKRFVAIHQARKSMVDGKSLLDMYLENKLGSNYLYCSLTASSSETSLTIDPRRPYKNPFILPQHGVGVLFGDRTEVIPFDDLKSKRRIRGVYIPEFGDIPFGYAL